jgi:rhodanese-related sulfurtransferase
MTPASEVKMISREELKDKIDRGDNFVLVETLPAMAYQSAHLPAAINLPPDEVIKRAYQVLPDKTADIVVYCGGPT